MSEEINYFQFEATFMRYTPLADGGFSLHFSTQELDEAGKLTIIKAHRQHGWVLFRENQFSEDEVPKYDAEEGEKSPSQRLRAALYVLWTQRGRKGDFESFYRSQIDQAIERVKKLLD